VVSAPKRSEILGLAPKTAARGWVSLRQFGQLIGVSYPTALRMRTRGYVEAIRVSGIWRISVDEVQRFIEEGNRGEVNTSPLFPAEPTDTKQE